MVEHEVFMVPVRSDQDNLEFFPGRADSIVGLDQLGGEASAWSTPVKMVKRNRDRGYRRNMVNYDFIGIKRTLLLLLQSLQTAMSVVQSS